MSTSRWQKFRLLMWKNYILQLRNPLQTVIEIVMPLLFTTLLVLSRSLVTPEIFPKPMSWSAIDLNNLEITLKKLNTDMFKNFTKEIVYSPSNPLLENLFKVVSGYVQPHLTIHSEESSRLLATRISQLNSYIGVEFPDSYAHLSSLPDKLTYSLRLPAELRRTGKITLPIYYNWQTDFLFPSFQGGGPRERDDESDGIPAGYYVEGFLFIQHYIFRAFMTFKNNLNTDLSLIPNIQMRRFPYPPFVLDSALVLLQKSVCLMILLGFVYPCTNIIKNITTEKEKQLKESMKIMGLDSWLHWTAWFTKCFIFMLITITLMTIMLKVQWYGKNNPTSVLTYSSATCLWFFLLIYSIATIMFCFMLSVFFSKASNAAAVASLMFFVLYAPFIIFEQRYDKISAAIKIIFSLFSNTAMGLGFIVILRYEGTQEGIQWHNIFKPVTVDDQFHLGYVFVMLALDSVLYFLVALYVEKIFPGDYGVAEKWNFPFTAQFWFGNKSSIEDDNLVQEIQQNEHVEEQAKKKTAGVIIKSLRKVYDDDKVAVEGLNLNMFEDQITVLLGHNGAGKTTTMSMLTGMIPPTSGTAIVNGKDIRREINAVRGSIGFCPQHNILFGSLTVREHIEFFSQLKGLSKAELEKEVIKYVKLLKLEDKIDTQAEKLSGGMKRKLSVGIALCGRSKVVLFDEPSSGVDPTSRRALWDLLELEKSGRTILLSTHFMDEADVLGDRIAIMASGKLKAVGSPFFLKKQFGAGYHLVCVKKPSCNVEKVTNLLQSHIQSIKVETDIGTELSYLLDETNISVFKEMLLDLETHSASLELESYGISMTTLEEVFLKVGSDTITSKTSVTKSLEQVKENQDQDAENGENFYDFCNTFTPISGYRLLLNQFIALTEKKFLCTWRNWMLLLFQIIIPVAFIMITIFTVTTFVGSANLPKLDLSIQTYDATVTTVEFNDTLYPAGSRENKIFTNYREMFKKFPRRSKLQVVNSKMIDHYLKISKKFLSRVNNRFLYGVTIESPNITVWFNNQPYHSSPISLSLIHNALLKMVSGKDVSISVANKPLPYKTESRIMMLKDSNTLGFHLSFNVSFALAFVASFFVIFYVKERTSRAKLLQFVSGIDVVMYWCTAFLWDFLQSSLVALSMTIAIGAFQEEGYSTADQLFRIFFVFLMFGFAVLPLVYISTLIFKEPASGFIKMSIIFIFLGSAAFSTVFGMFSDQLNLDHIAKPLSKFCLIFPHFAVAKALSNINILNNLVNVCQLLCLHKEVCGEDQCDFVSSCCDLNYFQWEDPGIMKIIVYFLLVGVFAFVILLLIEFKVFEMIIYILRIFYRSVLKALTNDPKSSSTVFKDEEILDSDVRIEKEKINAMQPIDYAKYNLVMKNLTKYYENFLAVDQLCVGVKRFECFGLLGVNGAGKTSTFKMLTGDLKISRGEAWVQGISIKTNIKEVHKQIGYCPQFDALIDELTGRETLRFFALSRGIPKMKLQMVTKKLASAFNFTKHLDKKVKAYSGGNKRKLSVSVALLGNPAIIYLDEPTSGMDPGARRNLWDVMCSMRDSGKSIILTSHSMEECEALCTRLAIMVNGQFKCLGSTQHLKSKFGEGFVLTLKLKRLSSVTEKRPQRESFEMFEKKNFVKEFVAEQFFNAVLKEEYSDMLTFVISQKDIKWSEIFGILEAAKEKLSIEDYALGQSSLEQIFLSFTKHQKIND